MAGNAARNLDLHPASGDYLGPARVTEVHGAQVTVEIPGAAAVSARMALGYPYQPTLGDLLLVISRGDDHYVIGVLDGAGTTRLAFPGDVEIRAEGGALRLAGEKGVAIEGPEVEVTAGRLGIMADAVVQKFGSLYQRVRDLLSVRARQVDTVVDEASLTRAKSATILTEETMSINGKQINLG